jgi:predicted acylesterase/phospholipase RssA
MVVGSVDTNSGAYITYNEHELKTKLPLEVAASASIPFVFPHRIIDGRTMMDGGTVWNTNLVSAIDRCKEDVEDDSQIVLDVIMCSSASMTKTKSSGLTFANFMRFREISSYYDSLSDVIEFKKAHPNVNYRYLFMPTEPLASGFEELVFDNSTMYPMV